MRITSERIAGCLVGGAIGDALGGVRERGALSISDDTQLTLATCEAIECGGRVSPEAIAANFLRYVVETVPLAIFVAVRLTTERFEATLTELAELAGDADTIAAIAGQIAGAHLGYSRLPRQALELAPVQAIIPAAKACAEKLAGGEAATG